VQAHEQPTLKRRKLRVEENLEIMKAAVTYAVTKYNLTLKTELRRSDYNRP